MMELDHKALQLHVARAKVRLKAEYVRADELEPKADALDARKYGRNLFAYMGIIGLIIVYAGAEVEREILKVVGDWEVSQASCDR